MPETHSASTEPSATNGQATNGHAVNGQPANGQPAAGQAANGEVESEAADVKDAPGSSSWFERSVSPVEAHTTEWFLRTGRAGLQPDSVTESWDEEGHALERPVTAADPPWAGERPDVAGESPPPWESGPWPGPGEGRPDLSQMAEDRLTAPGAGAAAVTVPAGNWQATAALGTGILPLVIPGLVFGVLGLRRAAATGVGRTWSLIGIGLSVIWAVVLSVFLATGGQPAPACGAPQTDVARAVSQVDHELSAGAPQSVLTQDLRTAINQANSAAAGASQLGVRNALVALTAGLQLAQQEASASPRRLSDAAIRAQVVAGLAVVTTACKA
jgi:hypothetical protein